MEIARSLDVDRHLSRSASILCSSTVRGDLTPRDRGRQKGLRDLKMADLLPVHSLDTGSETAYRCQWTFCTNLL